MSVFGCIAATLGTIVFLRLLFGFVAYRHGWRHGGGRWHGHGGCHGRRGWGGHRGGWQRRMLYGIFERLDATPGQEKAILAAVEELRAKVSAVRGEMSEARRKAAGAMKSDVMTPEEAAAVFAPFATHTDEIRAAAADTLRKIHDALDEKQRATLADLLERRWYGRG